MRLKSIKLAGFKSFVDPTTVNFPSNMCAVVGPNGCGKSNVIDAVRWVMGESSAKNLRGESMTDVIFNGSVNRQPVGQASIELIFDNSDGGVGGEWASYAEISIKRLVTREAQSEYYLNGTRCRRRDITDIFLGTGLGPRSYAIIEQGMISRLIESKPEDLRVFIEEAAGISKYKERRKETESRMRRTVENLERLTDLREELDRQLQHLQRQAQAAEKYREFKSEERLLQAQLQALQWQGFDSQITLSTRVTGELEVKLEAVQTEHQQIDTAIEQYRIEHTERTDTFNEVQANYYSLGSRVAQLEQDLRHQQERGTQLRQDLEQTRGALSQAESHLDQDSDKRTAWERELEVMTPQLEDAQTQEESSTESLLQAEEAMHQWQHQWDEFNQHAAEPRQQSEVQQSRIRHVEQVLQRLQHKIRQLDEEKQSLNPEPSSGQAEELQRRIENLERLINEHESNAEKRSQTLVQARERGSDLAKALNDVRSSLQQLRGRQASLEALQQAAREDAAGAVDSWLDARALGDRPRLVEQIDVERGWQFAVETVLAADLQAVCVDSVEAHSHQLQELQQGGLTLLEPCERGFPAPGFLAAKVSSPASVRGLLAGVRTAPDLASALAMRGSLREHESVITPDGTWLGAHWLRVQGESSESGGVIARQAELERIAEQLDAAHARERELEAELTAAQSALRDLENKSQEAQKALQAHTREHAQLSSERSAIRAKAESVSARLQRVDEELGEAREQFALEQQAIAEARRLLADAIERMDSDSTSREELLSARDLARSGLDAARQTARQNKDSAHQLAMRHQSLRTQLSSMQETIDRTHAQVAQLRERCVELEAAIADNEKPVVPLKAELEQQLELRLQAEGELGRARAQVTEMDHLLREKEQERVAVEHRLQAVRNELEQKRIATESLHVQRRALRKQLDDAGHDVHVVLQELPEDANEAQWQLSLDKIANRIVRLGAINLAAIDEFDLQSERKTYLDAQNEDLETALETLQSAIRKIDRETRNRFRDTFDRVNNGLKDLFPRVFGGGSAYLEMTGEDLLDTGISIMARPPGKKNSTIHLLSGGEKALTAIALVFSIFQLNPAPFCMLDEVDAPLDDANVGRYARMVKEMSDKLQFIFITHNKISMELADQLMGVTMHEPGVSRLVSVDVEEAAELAAS
ncbi:MAG: chromosome segregation protein SMC [Pseudomonadota bacterium]